MSEGHCLVCLEPFPCACSRVPARVVVGRVTGRVHQPEDAEHKEAFELFVEPEQGEMRVLAVTAEIFDWVRMGDVVEVDGEGNPARLRNERSLEGATWQP